MELKSRSEKSPQNALAKEMFSSSRVLSSTLLKIESCVENGLPRSVKRSAKQTKRNQRTIRTTKSNCADREQNTAGENGKHPVENGWMHPPQRQTLKNIIVVLTDDDVDDNDGG